MIDVIYEKVVFWKSNLFLVPSGKSGKAFIDEINRLLNEWLIESDQSPYAIKSVMIMPSLLLQKPSKSSKAKDHAIALERRLALWKSGDLLNLLLEAETIQNMLKSNSNEISNKIKVSKLFIKEMEKGNARGAIKKLTENMKNGVLPLTRKTLSELKMKHPEPVPPSEDLLFTDGQEKIHLARFEEIDQELIRKGSVNTKSGSGPSGLDGDGWCRILTSKTFGSSATDLRKTVAEMAKKLCSQKVQHIDELLACRLIPLDKNPGLRPIGVGKILRRIIGKAVMSVIRGTLTDNVGPLQTCAGHNLGSKLQYTP